MEALWLAHMISMCEPHYFHLRQILPRCCMCEPQYLHIQKIYSYRPYPPRNKFAVAIWKRGGLHTYLSPTQSEWMSEQVLYGQFTRLSFLCESLASTLVANL